MRKAQFAVKGKDGKTAEVVFFHFGPGAAGGVKANVPALAWPVQGTGRQTQGKDQRRND